MPNFITVHTGSGSTVHGTTGDDVFTPTGPGLAVMAGDDGVDVFNAVLGDVSEIAPWDENSQYVNGEGGTDTVNLAIHSANTANYTERATFEQTSTGNYNAAIYMTGHDPNTGNDYVDQWMGDFHGQGLNDGQEGLTPPGGMSLPPTGFDYAVQVTTGAGDDQFSLSGLADGAVNINGGAGRDAVTYDVAGSQANFVLVGDGEAYIRVDGRWDHVSNVESVSFSDVSYSLYGDPGDNSLNVDTSRTAPYHINGGAGDDTVHFNNNWDSAFITTDANGVTTVSFPARFNHGVDQTDTFINVEHLVFSDGHVVDLVSTPVPLSLTVTQMPADAIEAGIDVNGNGLPGQDTAVAVLEEKGTNAAYDMAGWTQTAPNSHQWVKQGTYGQATFTESSGTLYYTIDNALAATNGLAAGASASEGFTIVLGNSTGTVSRTVTFTVDGANDAPTLSGAQASLVNGSEDTTYTLHAADLLAGFSDPDGNALSLSGVHADHGAITDNHDGTYSLMPGADYNGQVVISYSVIDGLGGTINGSRSLSLDAVNDAPRLTGGQVTLGHGVMDHDYVVSAAALLTGYSDVEGDTLSVHGLSANHGTVTDNHDGTFTLRPASGYSGAVSLSYSVEDGHGGATAATQSLTLDTAGNHNPTAVNHAATTSLNHAVTTTAASLLAGAADSDVDALSVISVGNAAHGTVALNASGNAVYTPFVSYTGADTYSYTISDGHGGTATANVNVTVTGTTPSYTSGTSYRSGQTFDVSGDNLGHTVAGSAYDDVIWGGGQADSLNGGAGNDRVHGGAGKDTVTGGAGYDQVWGDGGADTFAFSKTDIADFTTNGGHYDEIMDFEGAGDGFHSGVGDLIRFNGFSGAATLTLDAARTAASADATAHYYVLTDGAYSAEIVVHYAGSMVLKVGDYGFYP